MNNTDTNMRVARVFDEAAAIVRDKNPRYGSSWRDQGWRGNLSRILEKSKRLRSMLWRRDPELLSASREHPRETLLDIINTAAFMVINMDDGLEFGHEQPNAVSLDDLVDIDEARRQYAFGLGKVVEQLFAEEWPAHLRKETDQFGPAMRKLIDNPNEITTSEFPVPGEEPIPLKEDEVAHVNKPSPTPRARVVDRGSGPRKRPIKDAPQA